MEQCLALFAPHLSVRIAEHEANCGEEVALARAIAPDDDIQARRKGLNDCLVFVTTSAGTISKAMRYLKPHATHQASLAHLLKPWMMICLINMVATEGDRVQMTVEIRVLFQSISPTPVNHLCISTVLVTVSHGADEYSIGLAGARGA